MTTPWYYAVAERDHLIQNPTSPEKIRLIGDAARLRPHSRVLDIASGKGGPAILLAQTFGCRIVGIERSDEFIGAARSRARETGLGPLVAFVHADASEVPLEPGAWDVAMCLGASFIWDGLPGTLRAMVPAVRPGGYVVVGEPYWRTWPLPSGYQPEWGGFATLPGTITRFEAAGLRVVSMIAASEDDWDRYETQHWRAVEEWLGENPNDPGAPGIREQYEREKRAYLEWERALLGWAIFVGWKR
jgi:SAM-dependent methyltransferase